MAILSHSTRVLFLRWVFPALALLTLIIAVAWPVLNDYHTRERSQNSATRLKVESIALNASKNGQPMQLQVTRPEYSGRDDQGRPYVVTAAKVLQDGLQPGTAKMNLDQPTAQLTLNAQKGEQLHLSANNGFFDNSVRTLQLNNAVKITHSDGYILNMDELFVDLPKGYAQSLRPVSGTGPMGRLSGESLEIFDKGAHIILHGHSTLVLNPKKAD